MIPSWLLPLVAAFAVIGVLATVCLFLIVFASFAVSHDSDEQAEREEEEAQAAAWGLGMEWSPGDVEAFQRFCSRRARR